MIATPSLYTESRPPQILTLKDSCHSIEYKGATIRYLVKRINNYHLENAAKEQEYLTLRQIHGYNQYNPSHIDESFD